LSHYAQLHVFIFLVGFYASNVVGAGPFISHAFIGDSGLDCCPITRLDPWIV